MEEVKHLQVNWTSPYLIWSTTNHSGREVMRVIARRYVSSQIMKNVAEFTFHNVNFTSELPQLKGDEVTLSLRHPQNWGSRMVASKGRESHLDFSSAAAVHTATHPTLSSPQKRQWKSSKVKGANGQGIS